MRHYSLEEWHDLTRAVYDIQIMTEPDAFQAQADITNAGKLITTKVRFSAQIFNRDPSAINDFDHEYLLFERYDRGEGRGVAGETATHVHPQSLHLVDMGQRYVTSTTDVAGVGVIIPYSLIGFDPSRDPRYASLPCSKPSARLLSTAFDALDAALAGDNPQETDDLANAFAGLVQRLMLGRDEDSELQNAESTTDLALRDYIEVHLSDPTLDAVHLCDRFGLSRASLYRRFRDDGGVGKYIVERRLDRCFVELCGAQPTRGRVKAVAARWGYTDAGNFNRRFRERFDLTPSECLVTGMKPPAAGNARTDVSLVHSWLRRHQH